MKKISTFGRYILGITLFVGLLLLALINYENSDWYAYLFFTFCISIILSIFSILCALTSFYKENYKKTVPSHLGIFFLYTFIIFPISYSLIWIMFPPREMGSAFILALCAPIIYAVVCIVSEIIYRRHKTKLMNSQNQSNN